MRNSELFSTPEWRENVVVLRKKKRNRLSCQVCVAAHCAVADYNYHVLYDSFIYTNMLVTDFRSISPGDLYSGKTFKKAYLQLHLDRDIPSRRLRDTSTCPLLSRRAQRAGVTVYRPPQCLTQGPHNGCSKERDTQEGVTRSGGRCEGGHGAVLMCGEGVGESAKSQSSLIEITSQHFSESQFNNHDRVFNIVHEPTECKINSQFGTYTSYTISVHECLRYLKLSLHMIILYAECVYLCGSAHVRIDLWNPIMCLMV